MLAGSHTLRIYTLVVNNAMLPAARGIVRWTGTTWENL